MQSLNRANIVPPLRLVFLMWLVFSISFSTGYDFGRFGVIPRTLNGLIGIITAPLVHGDLNHILSNTIPVLFLGVTLYLFYPRVASRVFIQCYVFTNFFVWVFARPFSHIGASGLVYALAFFLISLGIFKRDFKTIVISVFILIIYGGLVYGAFRIQSNVSWESHLFGAVVGGTTAYFISKYNKNL